MTSSFFCLIFYSCLPFVGTEEKVYKHDLSVLSVQKFKDRLLNKVLGFLDQSFYCLVNLLDFSTFDISDKW